MNPYFTVCLESYKGKRKTIVGKDRKSLFLFYASVCSLCEMRKRSIKTREIFLLSFSYGINSRETGDKRLSRFATARLSALTFRTQYKIPTDTLEY